MRPCRHSAADRGVPNVEFVHLRAEKLPAGLGTFRVASFAQSFHWLDRPLVAATVKTMLEPDGSWVHVHATTTHGVDDTSGLPRPSHGLPASRQIRRRSAVTSVASSPSARAK